eukprot:SAG22_NODE_5921_length_929_cov_2.741276_1_plen_63_part_01
MPAMIRAEVIGADLLEPLGSGGGGGGGGSSSISSRGAAKPVGGGGGGAPKARYVEVSCSGGGG